MASPQQRTGGGLLRERHVDHPLLRGDLRRQYRNIIFLDLLCLEQPLELGACLGRARKQQAAAGVHVEPVHRRGRSFETAFQLVEARRNGISTPARRVDRQARRLVEHERFAIDEQNSVGKLHRAAMTAPRAFAQVALVDDFVTPLQRIKGIQPVTQY